ncbi:MAG: Rne/Rng family ribonuclease, partial [Planctomycetes bacterium]|nr:Rne/Rng family ribonuclease [Planctomycetota bacterium]
MAPTTLIEEIMVPVSKKKTPQKRRRKKVTKHQQGTASTAREAPATSDGAPPGDVPVPAARQLDVSEVARPILAEKPASGTAQRRKKSNARPRTRKKATGEERKKDGSSEHPPAGRGESSVAAGPTADDDRHREHKSTDAPRHSWSPGTSVQQATGDRAPQVDAAKPQKRQPARRRGRRRKPEAGRSTVIDASPGTSRPETGKTADNASRGEKAVAKDVPEEKEFGPAPGREMIINVSAGDECRIAVLDGGRLEELFIERTSAQSHLGSIYKGRVVNVESSIQAVFVDFGLPKNGFLHISDVQPQYFPNHPGEPEDVGRKIARHNRPPIQKCFRRGQELIVQITKEGVGTKGPTLTTYLSIPGRFLVMMPGMSRHGVSRKIEDEEARREMRELLSQLDLPSDMGFILRTAGLGQSKRELQRDLNYLLRLWKTVVERIKRLNAPASLYEESDLVARTIRDVYTSDFARLVVDDAEAAKRAREFLRIAMPRTKPVVELYTEREPLFHRLAIEDEIERINMREVPLASGGSLVIDSTEAMVAIDVNSGRFRSPVDAEETAFRINLEAAEEIARQLRLRDLGGLIVCDFIDMRADRHKREVERALRDAMKKHKERARILRMSAFGLIEMTRQRQGPSLKRNTYSDCPHCRGTGLVKMPESVILDVMRVVQLAAHQKEVQQVIITVASDVAFEILNRKRSILRDIETGTGKEIVIRGDESFTSDRIMCQCADEYGSPVQLRGSTVATGG